MEVEYLYKRMRRQCKMNRSLCVGLLVLLASTATRSEPQPSRWSRQISSYTSDIGDWVPLTRPIERPDQRPEQPTKRQAVAQPRILTEPFPGFTRPTGFGQDSFQSVPFFQNQARPLYLQSVPSASQNYLTDQGFRQQGIRLALGTPQFPLSQGFVAPPHSFENTQPQNQRFPQNPLKFEAFPKQNLPQNFPAQKIPPPPTLPPQSKPVNTIPPPKRPEAPKFIDGYRLENASRDYNSANRRPQSLQKLKFESTPQFETFSQRNEKTSEIFPTRLSRPGTNVEREEVQLLYVPVESLNRGQYSYKTIQSAQNLNRDLFSSPAVQRPDTVSQSFVNNQKPQAPRLQQGFQTISQDYFNSANAQRFVPTQNSGPRIPTFGTSPASSPFPTLATTPKPKKLKPHQPPLAVFMAQESKKVDSIKVADVLSTLKAAKNIAVLDSVSPVNSPKVFIGPSSLSPPDNYVKFELPYLSNLENTDRKLRQLPFFVAPLSYSTPEGFAKIPFPSPHVGSVIVNSVLKDSNPDPFATSSPIADVFPNSYTAGTTTFLSGDKQTPFTNSFTKRPTFSYFSTSPPTAPQPLNKFQSNYFSFEPQSVNSIKPKKNLEPNLEKNLTPPAIPAYFPSFPSQYSNFNSLNNQQVKQQSTVQPPETTSFVKTDHFQQKLKFDRPAPPTTTTPQPSTTTVTSSKAPVTFPNYLLETHNPFSINQAFDFSSPVDYHNTYEENKKDSVTPSFATQTTRIPSPQTELSTERDTFRPSSPYYLQPYSPEIQYKSEILSSRFPTFDVNTYLPTTEAPSTVNHVPSQPSPAIDYPSEKFTEVPTPAPNPEYVQTARAPFQEHVQTTKDSNLEYIQATRAPNNYEESSVNREVTPNKDNAAESSSTTTTTRRPLRSRGRPRYSTPKPDSNDATTRASVTRKPLRERRPIPPRNRYDTSNKSTAERTTLTTRQPEVSSPTESSAYKSTRMRTRGRLHFKATDHPDELYEVNKKSKKSKEEDDIAYQRDILHQNYPVTLMERMSTVDIEAITSPSPRISSTRFLSREPSSDVNSGEVSYVTEQPSRYSTLDKSSVKEVESHTYTSRSTSVQTEQPSRYSALDKSPIKELEPSTYTSRSTSVHTEEPYVPRFSATINEEPSYSSRSSTRKYEEPAFEPRPSSVRYEQSAYVPRSSTSQIRSETTESIPVTTEAIRSSSFSSQYSDFDLRQKDALVQSEEEEATTVSNSYEISKVRSRFQLPENNSLNEESSAQEGEVTTITPTAISKIKPRKRPFAMRQQSVSSTIEAAMAAVPHKVARLEIKRRPVHPVTYRPAFDRRRTTMRIEEIEAELKTKQIHSRPDDGPENRHPVYKPEPTTERAPTTPFTKKLSQYRRRRPQSTFTSSTTTDTPAVIAKKPTYEIKNRFRGRRPSTEKTNAQSVEESITSTQKSLANNRFNHKSRITDRYNRKTETFLTSDESNEDGEQDADYSVHRPKIVPFEDTSKSGEDRLWSPDILDNSFKPFNPNDIQDASKVVTNVSRSKAINSSAEEVDIITVRNDYDDILLTVTPPSNKLNKKIPDIAPTLEGFVEQSKTTTTGDSDTISTIESVIEEMMKSLEEQDEDEYTRNVMKHEGGEIGEIPPERVITSGETTERRQQRVDPEPRPDASNTQESSNSNQDTEKDLKGRRRGYWKKVKVRPVTTESFEVAESQFYTNTVNHLGDDVKPSRTLPDITKAPAPFSAAPEVKYYTEESSDPTTVLPEIPEAVKVVNIKVKKEELTDPSIEDSMESQEVPITEPIKVDSIHPGDMDLGTGSPDPTIIDKIYAQTTEANFDDQGLSFLDSTKDLGGVMDYLLGFTTDDNKEEIEGTEDSLDVTKEDVTSKVNVTKSVKEEDATEKSVATEVSKETTTETSYMPFEINDSAVPDDDKKDEEHLVQQFESVKEFIREQPKKAIAIEDSLKEILQTTSESSFWDPASVVSTSMSTEISHETEICFRGKCIKTNKDLV